MIPIVIRLLPDGSGRVRIHWFERCDDGPIETLQRSEPTPIGPLRLGGAKGRIACRPEQKSLSQTTREGQYQPTVHSDDVRAVTCPECQATEAYKKTVQDLADILETNDPASFLQVMAGKVPRRR